MCQRDISFDRSVGAVSASFPYYKFTVFLLATNNLGEDALRQCRSFASKLVISNILKHRLGDDANYSHQKGSTGRQAGARGASGKLATAPSACVHPDATASTRGASRAGAAVWVSGSCRFCRELTREQLDPRASPHGAWHAITPAPPPVLLKGGAQWGRPACHGARAARAPGVVIDVFGGPERAPH